jgi:hypothetical protein
LIAEADLARAEALLGVGRESEASVAAAGAAERADSTGERDISALAHALAARAMPAPQEAEARRHAEAAVRAVESIALELGERRARYLARPDLVASLAAISRLVEGGLTRL